MPSSCRIPHNIFPLQRTIIRPRHCDASPPSPLPPLHHDVLCSGCPRHDFGYGPNVSICIIFPGGNFRDAHDAEYILYSMASNDDECTTLVQRFPPCSLTIYSIIPRPLPTLLPPPPGQPTPRPAGLAGLRPSNAPRASGWMADTSRIASCTPNVRHSSFAPSPPGGEDDDEDDDDDDDDEDDDDDDVDLPRR